MSPSKRFKPVLRIAESTERKAAHQLGESQRQAHEQQAKLDELKRYHQEYLEKFDTASRAGISIAQLREYQAFLAKLELAIKEQETVVSASQDHCEQRRDEWQQKHIRTQALDKVVQRCETDEQRTRDSREQKEQDDRSQRITKH